LLKNLDESGASEKNLIVSCCAFSLGEKKAHSFKWGVVTNPLMNSFRSFGKSKGKR
jgi:hypothetical protein